MMKNIFLGFFLSVILSGCATLNDEQCRNPNWERVGKVDGERGVASDSFKSHIDSCGQSYSQPAEEAYLVGWTAGNIKYCTPENGYQAGQRGRPVQACDKEKYPDFHEQYQNGHQVASLVAQKYENDQRIEKRKADQGFLNQVSRGLTMLNGRDPDQDLQDENKDIKQKISVIDRNSASSGGTVNAFSAHGMTYAQTLGYSGAFIGSFVGFGIGHAFQGRYMADGWKWTAGEVAAFGLMGANASDCKTVKDPTTGKDARECNIQLWTVLAWLGVRGWQIYDLWSYANKRNNIYAMPTANGVIVGYTW